MSSRHDAGMRAVARVREVRERDGRIGLQQARAEQRAHEARLAALHVTLAEATTAAETDVASFLRERELLVALGHEITATERAVGSATVVTESALAHWRLARTRLGAVELLLERRADARRQAAAVEEAKRLDEASALLWRRRQEENAS